MLKLYPNIENKKARKQFSLEKKKGFIADCFKLCLRSVPVYDFKTFFTWKILMHILIFISLSHGYKLDWEYLLYLKCHEVASNSTSTKTPF